MSTPFPIQAVGAGGVNTDIDDWNLQPNQLSYGLNYRTLDDKLQSFNGNTVVYTPPSNFYGGKLLYAYSKGNAFYIVLGRTANKVFDGSSWYNISSLAMSTAAYVLGADDELKWTVCMLGSIPVINNPQGTVEYWLPQQTSQILQPLNFDATHTWTVKGYSAKVFRAHKNFLFALNLTEGGVQLPYAYRWSHPAVINGLPFSWDPLDLSTIAGKSQIAGNGGDIIDGLSLRDDFIIYSAKSITVLQFTGDENVWQARPLSASYGLLAIDCLVEVKGIHYFIAEGDIFQNDGSSITSILSSKMRNRLRNNLSTTSYQNCFAIAQLNKSEVWFCIVEQGSHVAGATNALPNMTFIYNFETGSISIREVDTLVAGKAYAPIVAAPDTWGSDSSPWSTDGTTWGTNQYSLFGEQIIGIRPSDSAIVALEQQNPSTNLNTVLERTGLEITPGRVTQVVRVKPKITCSDTVLIQIGKQDSAGGTVTWTAARVFNPNTQKSVPIKARGPYICYQISSIAATSFTFSSITFEVEDAGER